MTTNNTTLDMSQFSSRLHLKGKLIFDTAHRIGDQRSLDAHATDLPILKTIDGYPYIPGSSFKGAFRSYVESMLRTLQEQPNIADENLSCLSVSKPAAYDQEEEQDENGKDTNKAQNKQKGRCLTTQEVSQYKRETPPEEQLILDKRLRIESCWVCRVFGSSWLASKVLFKDLKVEQDSFLKTQLRDGVGIDRDTGRAKDNFKYDFETVHALAEFQVEIVVENASQAELGLFTLGLKAFMDGKISLGGMKSRGLGWCHLEIPDWSKCPYVEKSNLIEYLFHDQTTSAVKDLEKFLLEDCRQSFLNAIQHSHKEQESNAQTTSK